MSAGSDQLLYVMFKYIRMYSYTKTGCKKNLCALPKGYKIVHVENVIFSHIFNERPNKWLIFQVWKGTKSC